MLARQDELVATVFSLPVIAEQLNQALDALPRHPERKVVGALHLLGMKTLAWIRRIINGLKRYGLKAPALVLRRLRGS